MNLEKPVILFDGVCNLCSDAVTFVIKHDPAAKFRFASIQSDSGQRLLGELGLPYEGLESFILIERDRYYLKSTAGLRILKSFSGLWPALYSFIVVPKFIRDFVYGIISKNRYKWFGEKDACMIPTPELRSRFL